MEWRWLPAVKFTEIESVWQEMNRQTDDSILLDSIFVRHLISEFGTGKEIIGVCCHENVTAAVGIFCVQSRGYFSTFQPSQAPLGLWMISDNFDIRMILKSLIINFPGINLVAGINQQDPNLFQRPQDSRYISTIDYITTSFIRIGDSFDSYWSGRSKNLRHNLKRQRNKLIKGGIQTRLETVVDPVEIHEAVKQYGDLESVGWKAKTGTNISIDNSQGRFYAKMLKALTENHRAVIFKYYYNDILAAVDLCIYNSDTLIILKTTYDENQQSSSPAMLLLEEIVQYVYKTGKIKKIEFFGKVMDWHTKWINEEDVRTMYHINYYRYGFLKSLHDIMFMIKKIIKG